MDETIQLKDKIKQLEETIHNLLVEQSKTKTLLKNSQEKLNLILEHSDNVYYNYVFKDATWSFISESMFQAIGVSAQDYISGGVEKASTYLHPDDIALLENHLQHILQNKLEKNYDPYIEYRMKHQITGEWRWFGDNRHVLFDDAGEPISLFGNSTDITEQKRAKEKLKASEEKFRSLAENSQDYIVRYDNQCRHLYQNAIPSWVSGFAREDFVGKTHREVGFEAHLCALWEEKITEVFQSKKGISQIFEWKKEDDSIFLDWRLFPEFDEKGNVKTVLEVSRDITEQKKLEFQLYQSQKMEALGTLAGGIAHDFNNLLVPILSYAEITKMYLETNSKAFQYQNNIVETANRAKDLIKNILLISRTSLGEAKPIQLENLVAEVLTVLTVSIPPSTSVYKDIAMNLPPILGDPSQIYQVILNICTNAIQAMEEVENGELRIHLNLANPPHCPDKLKEHQETFLCLHIQDNGCGMTPKTLAHIYDPFFTTKEKGNQKGTGLGLSIVANVVKQQKGHIEVESELGVGTSFYIYFPILKGEQTQTISPQAFDILATTAGEHILLVDDEKMVNEVGTNILQRLGYQVTTFLDSRKAFLAFEANPQAFQLVITDYSMQHLSGLQLMKKIKAIRSDIPILLITGYARLIDSENLSEWGCDGVIAKPYNVQKLHYTVSEALAKETA